MIPDVPPSPVSLYSVDRFRLVPVSRKRPPRLDLELLFSPNRFVFSSSFHDVRLLYRIRVQTTKVYSTTPTLICIKLW